MITRKVKSWGLVAALLSMVVVSAGCLEGGAVRTGRYLPAKPWSAPIDVYMDADPPYAYEEVGLVNAKGSGPNARMDDVISVLQDQARELGADAVIVTDTWSEQDTYADEHGYHTYPRLYASGVAIYYR